MAWTPIQIQGHFVDIYDGYVTDAQYIKGGSGAVQTFKELERLPKKYKYTIIDGSEWFCRETELKYRYNGKTKAWDPISGGGGGTDDYNALINKPTIDGVELRKGTTHSELGLLGTVDKEDLKKEIDGKQPNIEKSMTIELSQINFYDVNLDKYLFVNYDILENMRNQLAQIPNKQDHDKLDADVAALGYVKGTGATIDITGSGYVDVMKATKEGVEVYQIYLKQNLVTPEAEDGNTALFTSTGAFNLKKDIKSTLDNDVAVLGYIKEEDNEYQPSHPGEVKFEKYADTLEKMQKIYGPNTLWESNGSTETYNQWLRLPNYLKLTAEGDGCSISYTITGTVDTSGIQVSDDGLTWEDWTDGSAIELENGKSKYIRNTKDVLSSNSSNYMKFVLTGNIYASGDLDTMINGSDAVKGSFYHLFYDCDTLISTPHLNCKVVGEDAYRGLFQNCASLRIINGNMEAKTIGKNACAYMFSECESLEEIPYKFLHNAKNLTEASFIRMFNACTKLKHICYLPSEVLYNSVYNFMFSGCSALKVTTKGGAKIFTCPSTEGISAPVQSMFANTGGEFVGTPTAGVTYYFEK